MASWRKLHNKIYKYNVFSATSAGAHMAVPKRTLPGIEALKIVKKVYIHGES